MVQPTKADVSNYPNTSGIPSPFINPPKRLGTTPRAPNIIKTTSVSTSCILLTSRGSAEYFPIYLHPDILFHATAKSTFTYLFSTLSTTTTSGWLCSNFLVVSTFLSMAQPPTLLHKVREAFFEFPAIYSWLALYLLSLCEFGIIKLRGVLAWLVYFLWGIVRVWVKSMIKW